MKYIPKHQWGKSIVPIYTSFQQADTVLNPTGYTVKPTEKKSEVAEYMKRQEAENLKRRQASDVYTDPTTGKTTIQSQGITPVASPIDFAVGGVGALYNGGTKLLGTAFELMNPLPVSYKDLVSKIGAKQIAMATSKIENPLYLEKVWGRLNSSSKLAQDPAGYTLQLPFNLIRKKLNEKDTKLVDELLSTHYNWDDNTARTILTNKRLKIAKLQRQTDNIYDNLSSKITPTLVDLRNPLGTGAAGTAYPTKRINNVVKFGTVPRFETAESLKAITKVGKENMNPRIGVPNVIHKVDNVDSENIYAQVMKRVPGEPIVGSLKVSQESLDELQSALEKLRLDNIHLDYANPKNILYDKSTGKLSAVDFNTTPPPGSSFNAINKIHGTIKDNLEDRFIYDVSPDEIFY